MTWFLALGYGGAAAMLLVAVTMDADPRVGARLMSATGDTVWLDRDLLAGMGRRLRARRSRRRIESRLAGAGLSPARVDRVMGAKALLGAAGAVLGLTSIPGDPVSALPVTGVLGAAAFSIPDFVLARRVEARRARASASLPDLLDLVAVSVTAGSTPRLALDRASEAIRGPLGEEIAAARRTVSLGGSWRSALREVADRNDLRDLRRLAVTLDRAERLGSPVGEHLRELARQVRAERRAAEEERARRAPVAMLFPLVFLILPAFVLAAVVPAVLVATRGIV